MNWLEAMKAFAEGKEIQPKNFKGEWGNKYHKDTYDSGCIFAEGCEYRIAPKVYKYRFAQMRADRYPVAIDESNFGFYEKKDNFVKWLTPVIEIEME